VTLIEPAGIGNPVPAFEQHGLAVTSAFLFGPLQSGATTPPPICTVDHVRVLDNRTGANADVDYLDVLARIIEFLDSHQRSYQFVNISLGPDLAVLDDEVTAWTASLDERFAGGNLFATVAVGNGGERDQTAGLCRIQPPSDGVNVLAIGASDVTGASWQRAAYSSIGPGRTPGRVKPDGLIFGGSDSEPFYVLSNPKRAAGTTGTSFAAPMTLRTSAAVRVGLGDALGLLALRALTIHRAERHKSAGQVEVGWGRFETDPQLLMTCEDDEAIVLYQGELPIGEHLRCYLPMPDGPLVGDVFVSATLVISPEVDPSNPSSYTRSGLEASFRPNETKFRKPKKGQKPSSHAQTSTFFSQTKLFGKSERVLRDDGHKWEPCLSRSQKFRAKTLNKPAFDVYYHNRAAGAAVKKPQPIAYALIVGLRAPKLKDFYNRVVRAYSGILVPLKSQVQVQIR